MSIHLLLCLPRLRCPQTSACSIRSTQSLSSRLCTSPYHLSLASCTLSVTQATPMSQPVPKALHSKHRNSPGASHSHGRPAFSPVGCWRRRSQRIPSGDWLSWLVATRVRRPTYLADPLSACRRSCATGPNVVLWSRHLYAAGSLLCSA